MRAKTVDEKLQLQAREYAQTVNDQLQLQAQQYAKTVNDQLQLQAQQYAKTQVLAEARIVVKLDSSLVEQLSNSRKIQENLEVVTQDIAAMQLENTNHDRQVVNVTNLVKKIGKDTALLKQPR
jgi:hypothetical protein